MPSIFPEIMAGGVYIRDPAGNPTNPPGVENAYAPGPGFKTTCQMTALPSDCTARWEPRQANAITSEMISLAECWDADGPWDCYSVRNLCNAFSAWWTVHDPTNEINKKVNRSGDTMTGMLTLWSDPVNALDAATKQYVDGRVLRTGDKMTGLLILAQDPIAPMDAATKQYVDLIRGNLLPLINGKVNRWGDTMTGVLVLSQNPVNPMDAATKQYVDAAVAGVTPPPPVDTSNFVRKTGDQMSGNLGIINSNPALYLSSPVPNTAVSLHGYRYGLGRWTVQLAAGDTESGSNMGSSFQIHRWDDNGNYLSNPLTIDRRSGSAYFEQPLYVPTGPIQIGGNACYGLLANGTDVALRTYSGGSVFLQGPCGGEWAAGFNVTGCQISGSLEVAHTATIYGDVLCHNNVHGLNLIADNGDLWVNHAVPFLLLNDQYGNRLGQIWDIDSGAHWNHRNVSEVYMDNYGNFGILTGQGYQNGGGPWLDRSDARIKNVTGDYTLGLNELLQLRPVTYTFIGNDTINPPLPNDTVPYNRSGHYKAAVEQTPFVGLVAQEAEAVIPSLVIQGEGYIDGTHVTDLRTLNTNELTFALINAVKTLAGQVADLQEQLAAMKKG